MSDPIHHSKVNFILSQIICISEQWNDDKTRDPGELFSVVAREAQRGIELLNGKETDLTDKEFERLEKLIRVLARKLNKYQEKYRRETGQYLRVFE